MLAIKRPRWHSLAAMNTRLGLLWPLLNRGGSRALLAKAPPKTKSERTVPLRPIRILIVTARFHPDLGGTETHTHEVTRRMARHSDLDLTVLTTDRSGNLPVKEKFDGFTVLRCRPYPRNRDYHIAPGIYKHILLDTYDVVHCQGIHTAVPIIAMLAARQRRIPYLVTLHTGGHSSDVRRRLRYFQWRALGPLLRGAAVIVAVSRFEQRIFQKYCSLDPARFRIIQNGGDLSSTAERPSVVPGLIVSSGRLERYKGHQRAIEALPIVQQSIPDATLRILGSGPYEGHLRSLVQSLGLDESVAIQYIEPHDRTRMAMVLGTAAAVVALSEYEAHPVAVMEALTLGIPTVGLDTAGISDLVEDGLVKGVPRNAGPETIARALVAALECQRVSGSATLPTWDIAALNLAHLYRYTVGAAPEPLRSPGT
jgi:glycosyltransferase involved in cell wall biosynthesis